MHIGLVDLRWGGHHTPYVALLSRYFVEEGHRLTFVTDERHERLDELPNLDGLTIETLRLPSLPENPSTLVTSLREQYGRTRQLERIFDVTNEADVDVVHLLYFDRTQIPLRLATWRMELDVPIIATLHRDAFLSPSDGNTAKRLTQLVTTLVLDSTLKRGDLDFLTVHADSIRNRLIGGVDAATRKNTRTVPAPTPDYNVDASQEELCDHLGLPQDKEILLFFGGLREEKGPDILADLVQDLTRPVAVVYAGSPVDYTEADVKTWKERVEPPVEIIARLKYIPETDVNAYFAAADALVLPYRRTRGISGPLRRAAAVGTPTVGRAKSDIGDLIKQYDLGTTFDLDDPDDFYHALADALNTTRLESLESFARSRRWSESGDRFLNLYANAIRMGA